MAVEKEWRCLAHGTFEGKEALCPYGCDTVERVFLTPVGFASARTRNIDATLDSLARSHGMTDISNRGGRAAKGPNPNHQRQAEEFNAFVRDRYGDGWGEVPKGGTMNVQTGQVEGSGPGAPAALGTYHGRPDNALADARPIMQKMGPKPILVRRDHENLQVDVSKAP